MQFFVRGVPSGDGWIVNSLEVDVTTSAGRIRTFKSEEKIRQMAERGGTLKQQEDHQAWNTPSGRAARESPEALEAATDVQ